MLRLLLALILLLSTSVWAAEDPRDTYSYRTECPEVGSSFPIDPSSNFIKCQCTSYVAHKLNELWGNTSPRFTNQYYGFDRWGNAYEWLDRARSSQAEIGVTGARDNFVWDENVYSAVFRGDVALWNKKTGYPDGHVAYVEAAGADGYGRGVAWVTFSEYNITKFEYSHRTINKGDPDFPDYFLHIDKDRTYCRANPTVDTCTTLMAGKVVASGSGSKYGGLGGFGSTSSFNLKINRFWARDATTGLDLVSPGHTVRTGQALEVRNQVKAVNGDTASYMRPGKDRVETDLWVQEDDQEWRFLGREYIQATNLPSGATHTEHVVYTVPAGVSQVRFKAKIDVEDEAFEANEGDNWSPVIAFTVNNNPTVDLTITGIGLTNTALPVPAGGRMGARLAIRNLGTSAPSVVSRSQYAIRGPGTNFLWMPIADDGSDPQDLVPGVDHWEEILSLVTAPTVPGMYELRGCADYQGSVAESNENNNCLTTTFEVVPPRPDFVITAIGIAGGKTAFSAGTRIYPAMYVKNVGNANPTGGIRSAYYYRGPATGGAWVYITDDGTDARELCVGCQYREQYDGGMKIYARGTYSFMGCADYLGWQTESNEANNCTVSAPITIY